MAQTGRRETGAEDAKAGLSHQGEGRENGFSPFAQRGEKLLPGGFEFGFGEVVGQAQGGAEEGVEGGEDAGFVECAEAGRFGGGRGSRRRA
jgi:hypothetical protein